MAKKKVLCDKCYGLCCRYFALPIETPEDRDDYDDIRWYLCHENISVFVEDGDWYICIDNHCKHLCKEEHKCMIYQDRPRICRGYSRKNCDLIKGDYDYELHFTDDKQMLEYMKIKFDNKAKKGLNIVNKKKMLKKRKAKK